MNEMPAPPIPLNHIESEMEEILRRMLDSDETITARAVIRQHSKLKAASSITRNKERSQLLLNYTSKQAELRAWHKRIGKKSKDNVARDLVDRDERIALLEQQVEILTASHIAMIRAIGELGGFPKWAKFFEDYQSMRQKLAELGAMP